MRQAFTAIEFIFVIVILGIVAATVLPNTASKVTDGTPLEGVIAAVVEARAEASNELTGQQATISTQQGVIMQNAMKMDEQARKILKQNNRLRRDLEDLTEDLKDLTEDLEECRSSTISTGTGY